MRNAVAIKTVYDGKLRLPGDVFEVEEAEFQRLFDLGTVKEGAVLAQEEPPSEPEKAESPSPEPEPEKAENASPEAEQEEAKSGTEKPKAGRTAKGAKK